LGTMDHGGEMPNLSAQKLAYGATMEFSELGYGLMNIPVYNAEFRFPQLIMTGNEEEKKWLRENRSAIAKDLVAQNHGPLLNKYYKKLNDKISTYTGNDAATEMDLECKLLDGMIVQRLHKNKINGIRNSIVMLGDMHINPVLTKLR